MTVSSPRTLPADVEDRDAVVAWAQRHLGEVVDGPVVGSERFRGGQRAADAALAAFDVRGYASRRNEVLPVERRGASGLSPWIRHGMLDLPRVWDAVADGPARDRAKFRDELLWQEYARHLYARLGTATREPLRRVPHHRPDAVADPLAPRGMACLDAVTDELEADGWLVNQTRMWVASHWTVREGADWRDGEDWLFARLLDGSRAANRLGWQWTVGAGTGKQYGFSRWQVEKRAPELCASCPLAASCPIEDWPPDRDLPHVDQADPRLRADPDPTTTAGPSAPVERGTPEAVWLTAESLGDDDPALAAHPDLPVRFVFDAPLLRRLRLRGPRLVFLVESLADLATRREVAVEVGAPAEVLNGISLAATHAPVPGWRRLAGRLDVAVEHPWRWLRRPHDGSVQSFSAWRRRAG